MAYFSCSPRSGLFIYFVAVDAPDWSAYEVEYTDPSTKTKRTVVREQGWTRSDDAAPVGGVLATLVEKVTGPTGSHVEILLPTPAPAGKSAKKTAKKQQVKTTKKTAKKPAKKTAKKPAKKTAKKPAKKTAKKPAKKTTKKPAKKPARQKSAK